MEWKGSMDGFFHRCQKIIFIFKSLQSFPPFPEATTQVNNSCVITCSRMKCSRVAECNEEQLVFSSYEYLLTESKASNKLNALWLVPAHSEVQFQPVRGLQCLCCCTLFCLSSKFLYREEGKDLNRKMLTAMNSAVPKAQKDRQTQHHISECACNTIQEPSLLFTYTSSRSIVIIPWDSNHLSHSFHSLSHKNRFFPRILRAA